MTSWLGFPLGVAFSWTGLSAWSRLGLGRVNHALRGTINLIHLFITHAHATAIYDTTWRRRKGKSTEGGRGVCACLPQLLPFLP